MDSLEDSDEGSDNDKPFDDDEPFDPGVEADEEEDPEKFIQQLAGKIGTSLRTYTKDNGEPDFDLEKYVINSVISATHTAEMDKSDQKDIIEKIKTSGDEDEDEDLGDDEFDDDLGGDDEDLGGDEDEDLGDDEDGDTEENLEETIMEAEYKGKKIELNKPSRGDVKKYKVYVKNDKGNVVKVNFGDKNMEIRRDNPKARKSFRARHKCDQKKDKTTAGYWSCKFWSTKSVSELLGENITKHKSEENLEEMYKMANVYESFQSKNLDKSKKSRIIVNKGKIEHLIKKHI